MGCGVCTAGDPTRAPVAPIPGGPPGLPSPVAVEVPDRPPRPDLDRSSHPRADEAGPSGVRHPWRTTITAAAGQMTHQPPTSALTCTSGADRARRGPRLTAFSRSFIKEDDAPDDDLFGSDRSDRGHMVDATHTVTAGRAHPLGAWPDDERRQLRRLLAARHRRAAAAVRRARRRRAHTVVDLDPETNRSFCFWHVYVAGIEPGAFYAYRVRGLDGPDDLHGAGHRFEPDKVLVDPYAKGLSAARWQRGSACGPEDNVATSLRSVVVDLADYDWEGDVPLSRPMAESIDLRDARGRLHPLAVVRRRAPRHLRRRRREDPLPAGARRHRRRAAAGLRVRPQELAKPARSTVAA